MFSAITSALILSGRLLLPGVVWTAGQPARSWLDRAGRIAVAGLLLNLLPALLLGAVGRWTLPLDWLAWGLVTVGGAWWNRSRFQGCPHGGIRLAGAAALLAAAVMVPMLLPARSEWLAGGWDPGMYQNNAVAIAHRNGLAPKTDSVYNPLTVADRQLLSDAGEIPYHEIMPAVPIRLGDGALPLYFPPLTPVCGAWFYRIGGMSMLVRTPVILAFLGLLAFLAFTGRLGLTRLQRGAAFGFLLMSPVWWYHQAIPTSEMLTLFLLYGGVVFYMQAMEDRRRIPVAAMLVLFAATVNHFSAPVFAGILLLLAAVAESAGNRPHRQWRLAACFGALLAGLCFGLHTSWITLARLQEKDAALSVVLTVVLAAGALSLLLARRPFPVPVPGEALIRAALQVPMAGLLILSVLLSVGTSRDAILPFFDSVPFAGSFLHPFSRYLEIHGTAWFLLAFGGAGFLIRERKDGSFSTAGLVVPVLGLVFALLLGSSSITPIYPWALRRTMMVAIPFMAIAQAGAAARILERDVHAAWRVLLAVLAAAAVFGGLRASRHAMQVGDYAGLVPVLDELDASLQPGDVVIVDDARWGTPLLLACHREVLNGERLLKAGEPGAGAFLEVVRRIRRTHHGRILWLTSSEAGLGVYPAVPDYTEPVTGRIPFAYRTVIHSAHERRFRMESRHAVFQLHEQMGPAGPSSRISQPGPYRLLADLSGERPDCAVTLQWEGGQEKTEVRPRAGWQLIDLPLPASGAFPELQWAWSREPGRPPQFLLHAPGDALTLAWWNGHLYPEGTRVPWRGTAGEWSSVFPLPFFPGDAAIQATLSASAPLPAPASVCVRMGSEMRNLRLGRGQAAVSAFFAHEDAQSVSIAASDIAGSRRLTLRLQPLYAVLDCVPSRTGVYVFQTVTETGVPGTHIARSLAEGLAGRVESGGLLIGECVFFHPGGEWHHSDLDDDALVRFLHFHSREDTGDPQRPCQRWTASGNAVIQVIAPPDTDVHVRIRLRDVRPPAAASAGAVLRVGTEVLPVVFSNSTWTASVVIPAGDRRDAYPQTVSIRFQSDTWSPASVLSSGDARALGLLVDELSLYFTDKER